MINDEGVFVNKFYKFMTAALGAGVGAVWGYLVAIVVNTFANTNSTAKLLGCFCVVGGILIGAVLFARSNIKNFTKVR